MPEVIQSIVTRVGIQRQSSDPRTQTLDITCLTLWGGRYKSFKSCWELKAFVQCLTLNLRWLESFMSEETGMEPQSFFQVLFIDRCNIFITAGRLGRRPLLPSLFPYSQPHLDGLKYLSEGCPLFIKQIEMLDSFCGKTEFMNFL